jgi:hypothetical protein
MLDATKGYYEILEGEATCRLPESITNVPRGVFDQWPERQVACCPIFSFYSHFGTFYEDDICLHF